MQRLYDWRYLRRILYANSFVNSLTVGGKDDMIAATERGIIKGWKADGSGKESMLSATPSESKIPTASIRISATGELWVGRRNGSIDVFPATNGGRVDSV